MIRFITWVIGSNAIVEAAPAGPAVNCVRPPPGKETMPVKNLIQSVIIRRRKGNNKTKTVKSKIN